MPNYCDVSDGEQYYVLQNAEFDSFLLGELND